MKSDMQMTEMLLLRGRKMNFSHKGLNSFEGSKKREIIRMPSYMIKHALLKMLPELHKRLQHKCRQMLLHRHKLRLLCKHKYKQQLRLDN
jgi:ABC-type antimicrobial peptide transport system ATPase subunit